ncbi:MAG: helix-turn-helix domain-containing protein [Aggregatilineales bacterium]
MAKTDQFDREVVIKALEQNNGIVRYAALSLGCSRTTLYNYINKYKTVEKALKDARESTIDYVEGKLIEQIGNGNITAIIYYLKTQGKHRGYSERFEVTGKDGSDLFSPDVVALLKAMGETPESAVKQFEAMIRQQARQDA